MWTRIVAVLLFLLAAAAAAWFAVVATVHRGTLSVPELRGLDAQTARELAHDVGLEVVVEEPGVFSSEVPPGSVAAQEPVAGFHVKSGSRVTVRLSVGSERATVPEVRGESLQGAVRALEQVGLRPGARIQVEAHTAGDRVVATDPPAGTEVPPDHPVALLVNVTPARELWVMPSLLTRTVDAVRGFCRVHRLRLGQVHEVAYPGLPSGVVLRQYPPAGAPLSRSDIVTVWISQ